MCLIKKSNATELVNYVCIQVISVQAWLLQQLAGNVAYIILILTVKYIQYLAITSCTTIGG